MDNQKKTFFQTPLDTSYGPIVHHKQFDYKKIFAHFCQCGLKANVRRLNNETYVGCSCSTDNTFKHKSESVAILKWNASSSSQFPSRISISPLFIESDMKFDPKCLRDGAISKLNIIQGQDESLEAALHYVVSWCDWITNEYYVLSKDEMEYEQVIFHKAFKARCLSLMNDMQKKQLSTYEVIHQHSRDDKRFYIFAKNYCRDIFEKVTSSLPHPTKVKANNITGVLVNA